MTGPVLSSVISALLFAAAVSWIVLRRRFLIFLLLFLLIAYTWRLVSTIYIDAKGPVYSVQLFREIGPGYSSLLLVLSLLTALSAILLVFSRPRIRRLAEIQVHQETLRGWLGRRQLSTVVFVVTAIFILLLCIDLVRIGEFPIFTGTEEFVYTRDYAGIFHRAQFKYGNLIAFFLGLLYWNPVLLGKRPDRRFLAALFVILIYMLVTGYRYSPFFSYCTFFLMPFGVLLLNREAGSGGKVQQRSGLFPPELKLGVLVVASMVVFATARSLVFYRVSESEAARDYLTQRVLIQQGELWWGTYERVFVQADYDMAEAFRLIFLEPIVANRNSTSPFLMLREIGPEVYRIVEQGSAYSGGYPEVAFELLGPLLGFPMLWLLGLILGLLMFYLVKAILLQRAVRTFLIFYVLYAFLLTQGSGMLNNFVSWKFWVKVAAMIGWLLLEVLKPARVTPQMDRQAPVVSEGG